MTTRVDRPGDSGASTRWKRIVHGEEIRDEQALPG